MVLVEFHPSAAAAFDKLPVADQERIDVVIEHLYYEPLAGELLRGGPLRQCEAEGVQVVYFVPPVPTMIVICYVQGSE
ncbi:type II toxin-antitoxin system RelE/ParE family toxin [Streptomyces gardneri]|uniref:type II toxin-antitoxin system RelE family toxin n=1 Tax=Streptomyces gardneri TaxID=66892 RepID=UPI00369DB013